MGYCLKTFFKDFFKMESTWVGKIDCLKTIEINKKKYKIYSLKSLYEKHKNLKKIPFSLKILLENLLRNFDGKNTTDKDINYLASCDKKNKIKNEITYYPAR